MKRKMIFRAGALTLALAMTAALAGCSEDESSSAPSATETPEAASSETATGETADPYAYLADFSYSDAFDDNGYLIGVTASDYVTPAG